MVFCVILSGWSSNSKYSLIGRLRSVAQRISYEAVFRTLFVFLLVLFVSYSLRSSFTYGSLFSLFLFPFWFICVLAETHRAPFDFREAERELVSGFNTEYSGAYFAFIFLSEYSVLLFSCILMGVLFFSASRVLFSTLLALVLSFLSIWVRITFCRFRYDLLIGFSWKILLPLVLAFFFSFLFLV